MGARWWNFVYFHFALSDVIAVPKQGLGAVHQRKSQKRCGSTARSTFHRGLNVGLEEFPTAWDACGCLGVPGSGQQTGRKVTSGWLPCLRQKPRDPESLCYPAAAKRTGLIGPCSAVLCLFDF